MTIINQLKEDVHNFKLQKLNFDLIYGKSIKRNSIDMS